MKRKKSSFANTSTGYGKRQGHTARAVSSKTEKKNSEDAKSKLEVAEEQEKDLNSGFGEYLKSPEAVEMMKLFVFANTVMLILTMAWPNLKEQYYMLMHWLATFQKD